MQINVTGHHVEITDTLRDYAHAKLQKLTRRFANITQAHVVLTVEKLQQKAEANVHLAGGEIYAESIADDMYAAIDGLIDKLERQVVKHKEKMSDRDEREI